MLDARSVPHYQRRAILAALDADGDERAEELRRVLATHDAGEPYPPRWRIHALDIRLPDGRWVARTHPHASWGTRVVSATRAGLSKVPIPGKPGRYRLRDHDIENARAAEWRARNPRIATGALRCADDCACFACRRFRESQEISARAPRDLTGSAEQGNIPRASSAPRSRGGKE